MSEETYYSVDDISPGLRKISDRDYRVLKHVVDNLAYAGEDFGISRTAVAKIFWKHMKRFSLCYKSLDYYAQLKLCTEDSKPLTPLEFVKDNRQLIKEVIKRFYY